MQLGDSSALVDVTLVGGDDPEPREHTVVVVECGDITGYSRSRTIGGARVCRSSTCRATSYYPG
jgi:hypothetical protein